MAGGPRGTPVQLPGIASEARIAVEPLLPGGLSMSTAHERVAREDLRTFIRSRSSPPPRERGLWLPAEAQRAAGTAGRQAMVTERDRTPFGVNDPSLVQPHVIEHL